MRRILISLLLLVPALLAVQGPAAQAAPSGVSLAGVHFYSGDISMVDQSIPAGQRGWNVEHVANVASCDGNAINAAATAQSHGLVNIIRMTYNHPLPVPVNTAEYESWKNSFKNCVNAFGSRASIYIVGNEPNIDCAPACPISAQKYADAFNYLYARKGEMRAGTELLAVFNSPFTPASWFYDMTRRLSGSDGFAVHTGGIRAGCSDPRQPCADWADSKYDGAFRFYRDMISQIDQRFWDKPVYITEFNTYAGGAAPPPADNYQLDWVNKAYQEIRHYNANRNGRPEIKALVWFVDAERAGSGGAWWKWALTNPDPDMVNARNDMKEEFRNAANRTFPSGVSPHWDVFARGTDNQIHHQWKTTGGWSGWAGLPTLAGGASSDPSAVSWGGPLANGGSGRVDLFALSGGNLWHTWFDGTWRAWENWGNPGVSLIYSPDVASMSWGRLDVFAVGSNQKIYQRTYSIDNGLGGWGQPFTDGTATSAVSAVSWGSGRIDLFVRGSGNQLWQRSWNQDHLSQGGAWSGWQIGTGTLTTGPDAASWGAGRLDVFVASSGALPQRLVWTNGSFSWQSVPDGSYTSDPGAVSTARNQVSLFARGQGNNALWHKPWTAAGGWGGWEGLTGVLTAGPDAASWSLR